MEQRRVRMGWIVALLLAPLDLRIVWEEGEVPVMTALLEAAGRWPAPADWHPDDPGRLH